MRYFEKAGPFIGPRGGKWADSKHTIPWDDKKAPSGGGSDLYSLIQDLQSGKFKRASPKQIAHAQVAERLNVLAGQIHQKGPNGVIESNLKGFKDSSGKGYHEVGVREPGSTGRYARKVESGGHSDPSLPKEVFFTTEWGKDGRSYTGFGVVTQGGKTIPLGGGTNAGYKLSENMRSALKKLSGKHKAISEGEAKKSVKKAWETILDLEKAGPFIGPRGGKWADSKHTIPWDDKKGGGKAKQSKKGGGKAKKSHHRSKSEHHSSKVKESMSKLAGLDSDSHEYKHHHSTAKAHSKLAMHHSSMHEATKDASEFKDGKDPGDEYRMSMLSSAEKHLKEASNHQWDASQARERMQNEAKISSYESIAAMKEKLSGPLPMSAQEAKKKADAHKHAGTFHYFDGPDGRRVAVKDAARSYHQEMAGYYSAIVRAHERGTAVDRMKARGVISQYKKDAEEYKAELRGEEDKLLLMTVPERDAFIEKIESDDIKSDAGRGAAAAKRAAEILNSEEADLKRRAEDEYIDSNWRGYTKTDDARVADGRLKALQKVSGMENPTVRKLNILYAEAKENAQDYRNRGELRNNMIARAEQLKKLLEEILPAGALKKSMEYDVMSITTVEEVEELVKATCGSKTAYKGMAYKGYDMEKADDEEEEEEEMDPALAEAAKDDPSLLEDEEKSVKKAWETILDLEKAGPFVGPRGGKWADSKHTIPWKENKHAGKAEPKSKGHDESGARELQLHVENSYSHHNQHESIRDNLVKKIANGKYDHAQASKLFEYLAESGSKSYSKEFGAPAGGGHHFDPATRRAVARQMANDFHDEVKDGEHDHRLKGVHAKRAKAGGGISKMAHGHGTKQSKANMKKSLSKGVAMMVCSMCGHSQSMESSISVSEEPHMTNLTVDGGHPNGGVTQEASTSDLMLKGVHGHNLEILSRMDPDTAVYVLMNKDMIDKANGY